MVIYFCPLYTIKWAQKSRTVYVAKRNQTLASGSFLFRYVLSRCGRRVSQRRKYFSFAVEGKTTKMSRLNSLNLLWPADKGILFQLSPGNVFLHGPALFYRRTMRGQLAGKTNRLTLSKAWVYDTILEDFGYWESFGYHHQWN